MNPQWFGDLFDIVKCSFVENLNEIEYHVVVDPMLTGEWDGLEYKFYTFLKEYPLSKKTIANQRYFLILTPELVEKDQNNMSQWTEGL